MSYCLNPDCTRPQNPIGAKFCQNCGSKLLLQGRYRALKLIGQGGFGRTFLAVDEAQSVKPRCVIKQFFPQSQSSKDAQKAAQLFEQEAVRLEELGKHPQIPQFLEHFAEDNRQYLVQEFIDGQNLAEVLDVEGAFTEVQIRDLLNNLLPVLEFIHSHNIIHRDIKPENIIRRTPPSPPLARGGGVSVSQTRRSSASRGAGGGEQWVLVDFGAAKYATGTALGRTGTVIGSAGYAAPEQAGGKAVFPSDIYSLGVTCLHLLTQTEPFDLYSFSEASWVWRDYLRRPVSRQLGQVLDRMVAIATSQRFQWASEVLNALNTRLNLGTRTLRAIPTRPAVDSPQPASRKVKQSSQLPIQNWQCVDILKGHRQSIRSLAISPDGEILASGSDDKTIKLWELATGEELCTLRGHSKSVGSIAISADGETLASGSDDKTIKLWQLTTGLQIGTVTLGGWFSGDAGCVYAIAISPDGQLLASLSSSGAVQLWNLKTGQEIHRLQGDTSWVHSIAMSPDGQTLAAGSDDRMIKLWDISTGRRLRILRGHTSWVRTLAFSPDGRMLASGSSDTTIKLWDTKTGQELYTLKGHERSVHSVAFCPVPMSTGDRSVSVTRSDSFDDSSYETTGLTSKPEIPPTRNDYRTQGVFDEVAFPNEAIATPSHKRVQRNRGLGITQILASSSADKTIKLWDIRTGRQLCILEGHRGSVRAVAFSPDGETLVSGGGDNSIYIWQCDRGN